MSKPSKAAPSPGWLTRFDRMSDSAAAGVYLTPTYILLALTILFPMAYALFLSFTKMEFVSGHAHFTFVGADNYIKLVQDARIPNVLLQTFLFTVVKVAGTLFIAFGIALTIFHGIWGGEFFKRIFLIPWALSNVVNGLMWKWMYNGNNGIINELMQKLGLIDEYKSWLAEGSTALGAVIIADIWKSVPFAALILLAGLQTISKELYDAGQVDGAGTIQRFFHITLPSLRPVLMVLFVMETMWALRAFDIIWVLTQGGPLDKTMVINVYAYEQAFRNFDMGYGSALAFFITLCTLLFTAVYLKTIGKND
ncbi:sugar ABC transporter permease [Paenibacillus doosanensis]|uniref:Trehalose transport system permease protein SugA n=1 Tax=Paenibacillus konkukensis TaxID=2020716 RepID=A0ABY4RQ50_9BACL|nr:MULTISPECIES: sugar ABC transporter permease [Paenibacillus]MCS7462134.1 sugar ABC transporter permease [Paenibacillus doosanensis]UQZ83482.1 Trehalose transport system permease protein SugA [Paenibacillus konkukensis]